MLSDDGEGTGALSGYPDTCMVGAGTLCVVRVLTPCKQTTGALSGYTDTCMAQLLPAQPLERKGSVALHWLLWPMYLKRNELTS